MEECASILKVKRLKSYTLEITFQDGTVKIVDLEPRLHGRLFGALRDPKKFRKVRVEKVMGGLEWPNGADICPDLLYRS